MRLVPSDWQLCMGQIGAGDGENWNIWWAQLNSRKTSWNYSTGVGSVHVHREPWQNLSLKKSTLGSSHRRVWSSRQSDTSSLTNILHTYHCYSNSTSRLSSLESHLFMTYPTGDSSLYAHHVYRAMFSSYFREKGKDSVSFGDYAMALSNLIRRGNIRDKLEWTFRVSSSCWTLYRLQRKKCRWGRLFSTHPPHHMSLEQISSCDIFPA